MKHRVLLITLIFFISCTDDYTPKPRAFSKLEFPKKEYHIIELQCPFSFELANYSVLIPTKRKCLFDVDFPQLNGKLYITYLPLKNNLHEHTEQSRKLAYKHNVIADGITEQLYINDSLKVYGVLYDYEGVTATAAQFYLTDSVNHFFRGALYFNTEVSDSILPITLFLKYDIKYLIETFRWKDK